MGGGADRRVFIRNPASLNHPGQLIPLTTGIVEEFADMLTTIATSASDNKITPEEARKIRARWEELKSVTESFVRACESGNFGEVRPAGETPKKT